MLPALRGLPQLATRLLTCLLLIVSLSPNTHTSAQEIPTTTVVDILSANVEFSYFLRLLQRNQLIPYLNQVENITLIAPVNSAFAATFCADEDKIGACMDSVFEGFTIDMLRNYIITSPVNTSLVSGTQLFTTAENPASPIMIRRDPNTSYITVNDIDVVEQDLFAVTQNSYVQGIEKCLKHHNDISSTIKSIPETAIFNSIYSPDTLDGLTGKTIFVLIDDSFDKMEPYELNYFFTAYADNDKQHIIKSLVVDGLHGGDVGNLSLQDQLGYPIQLSSHDSGMSITVNNTITAVQSNIISKGSIIHLFNSSSLIPDIEFNVMKALVGLKADSFVDELLLEGLTELITNNTIEQTIFYPQDSSNDFFITSKSANLYHFVDERITNLSDTKTLYDTKFCNAKKMGSHCQKIKVEAMGSYAVILNNNIIVESGPYEVGNTLIYLTDENLRTPGDLMSSINSAVFHCTRSLQYIIDTGLNKLSSNYKGYTFLLPCFDSWDDYDLTLNYLEQNSTAMDILMRNLALEGLVYTDFIEDEAHFSNLNGEDVVMRYDGEEDKLLNLSYNDIPITLKRDNDILFNQGVVQPIKQVIFPAGMEITMADIFEHSDATIFLNLLKLFPDLYKLITSSEHSILLPSAASLLKFERPSTNQTLEEFLKLHIIPSSSLEDLKDCSENGIRTLHPKVNLTCSSISRSGDSFLQIENGADNGVRILRKGCISSNRLSCVYLIDRPFSLNWIDDHEHYHISLPGIAIGLGMIIGSLSMITVLVCLMMVISRRKKGVVPATDDSAEPNETTALIQDNGHTNGYANGHANGQSNGYNAASQNFESQYSANTLVNPISVGKKRSQQHLA